MRSILGKLSCAKYLCKKLSYELAFSDPFAMLSRPHVLLSRALFPLELLSRRFRGGLSHSMQAFAGLSRRDLLCFFRHKLSPAFAACVLAFAGILEDTPLYYFVLSGFMALLNW